MSTVKESTSEIKILLVKAGSTDLDEQGRICGALDLPLSECGRDEASDIAHLLSDLSFKTVYSAACMAARETAAQIQKLSPKVRLRVEESWANLDHGLWHGKCLEELKENAPKLYRQWQEHPEIICPPDGETFSDVAHRCRPAVERLLRKLKSGTVVVVAPEPLLGILEQLLTDHSRAATELQVLRK